MTDAGGDSGNLERLLSLLGDGSLAKKLVEAWKGAEPDGREAALKRIAEQRMAELRATDARAED